MSASSWFYFKKFNTMHGHMNVKFYAMVLHDDPNYLHVVESAV